MPTWSTPIWLWLLLLVPVYFVLHLLFQTVQNQPFSSLRLWKRVHHVLNRTRRHTFSYRSIITSLLLSFLLTGIIFSLAGPLTTHPVRQNNLHVLIDMSASMTIENKQGASRYQRALRKLEQIADQSPPSSTWTATLLSIPARTKDGSPSEIIQYLHEQTPTDLSYRRSLADLVNSTEHRSNRPTYFITDTPASAGIETSQRLLRLTVGSSRENAGIVSLRGERNGSSLELMIQIAYHGSGDQPVRIICQDADGTIQNQVKHEISAGKSTSIHMNIEEWNGTTGRVRIEPDSRDALSRDNVAFFSTHSPYQLVTLQKGQKNNHVRNLLSSISTVRMGDDDPDVLFVHNPDTDRTRNIWHTRNRKTVVVNPAFPSDFPLNTNRVEKILSPQPQTHQIVKNLSMQNVIINNPHVLTKWPDGASIVPLINFRNQPVAFLRRGTAPQLWMLFDPFLSPGRPMESNWSIDPDLYPGFVQFWQNVIEWFQPLNVPYRGEIVYWKTGERTGMKRFESTATENVQTTRIGLFEIRADGPPKPLPVNLTSRSETNTIRGPDRTNWSSIRTSSREVTETDHTRTLSKTLLFLFLFVLITISFLHRAS